MRRGLEFLRANTTNSLREAVACFDRAVELRRTLLVNENPEHLYGLTAGLMNRADALTRLGAPENLSDALLSYDEAIELLQSGPGHHDVRFRQRLAIAWLNRGFTLQAQQTAESFSQALRSFDQALALFDQPIATPEPEGLPIVACLWMNRGNVLLSLSPERNAEETRAAVKAALALVRESERDNLLAAEIALKSRYLLCQANVHLMASAEAAPLRENEWLTETADATDDAMSLGRFWETQGARNLRALVRELFRFGVRWYESHQPWFLAEFIVENVDPADSPGVVPLDEETGRAILETLQSAANRLYGEAWASIGQPKLNRVLEILEDLRSAEESCRRRRKEASPDNYSTQDRTIWLLNA
jgi:tetratricopeptide (TPR) repeat protein